MKAASVLDREFLEIRCRLIDLAASLDRIERGEEAAGVGDDPRMVLIRGAIALLCEAGPDRAQKMQMHFSDEYRDGWREEFGL